jgi:hypothetical protein
MEQSARVGGGCSQVVRPGNATSAYGGARSLRIHTSRGARRYLVAG